MNHHQNNDVPAVTTKLDGVVLQRILVMRERATVMVLVMVVYMMVMMVVRGILLVEATTVRSLATIIMRRMIAVNVHHHEPNHSPTVQLTTTTTSPHPIFHNHSQMFLISHLLVRDVLDVTTKEEDVVHQRIPAMRVRVIVMVQEMEEEMMDTWDVKEN